MQRRFIEEDIPDQKRGDFRVDDRAGADDIAELGAALEHDQRAGFGGRQGLCRIAELGQLGAEALRGGAVEAALDALNRLAAHFFEHAAQLGLEHDDERDKADVDDAFQNIIRHPHLQPTAHDEHQHQHQHAERELARAAVAHELEQIVQEERDDDNIYDVRQLDGGKLVADVIEKILDRIHQNRSPSNSGFTYLIA